MRNTWLNIAKKILLICMLCIVMNANPLASGIAYADVNPTTGDEDTADAPPMIDVDDCGAQAGFAEEEITSRVVYCVKAAIIQATKTMVLGLSKYIQGTVIVAYALALALFGIKLIGGETELNAKTLGLLARFGLVAGYGFALNGYTQNLFDVMDWFVSLVIPSPDWTPWEAIDTSIGKILGFGGGRTLVNGIAGIIFAAALSAATGTAIFGAGILAFFSLMMIVLDIVYVYLTAVLLLGFSIVISPLIIPMGLFKVTERFFNKWLKNVIGALIIPMFLFCFLSHMLVVFDTLIVECVDTLSNGIVDSNGNPSFKTFWRANQPILSWLTSADPNQTADLGKSIKRSKSNNYMGPDEQRIFPPIGTEIDPFKRVTKEMSVATIPSVDYDADTINQIIFTLIALWVYCQLLLSLIRKMPEIAATISSSTWLSFPTESFKQKAAQAKHDASVGFGAIVGGALGGGLGGAASKGGFAGRSAGTVTGMLIGGSAGPQVTEALQNKVAIAINKQISGLIGRRKK